jgi:hypothetical protein
MTQGIFIRRISENEQSYNSHTGAKDKRSNIPSILRDLMRKFPAENIKQFWTIALPSMVPGIMNVTVKKAYRSNRRGYTTWESKSSMPLIYSASRKMLAFYATIE